MRMSTEEQVIGNVQNFPSMRGLEGKEVGLDSGCLIITTKHSLLNPPQ